MNLYSNKQKWKIVLMIFALLLIGASLFVSNRIVSKVGQQERNRAHQWADAIKKKIELVQLTNNTFKQLREKEHEKMQLWVEATKVVSRATDISVPVNYEFPLQIISENKEIPVVVIDNENNVSGYRNLDFDTSAIRILHPDKTGKEIKQLFKDSLFQLATIWGKKNPSFTIEVYTDLFMTYCYNDSKEIVRLEAERDSLISSFNNDLINNDSLVPVMLVDASSSKIVGTNLSQQEIETEGLQNIINRMKGVNPPIVIDFDKGEKNILYYDDSPELKRLQYFPYIQFVVIILFVLIAYLIFSTFRKAEQNQVWAGMAKETAHQLGTPLSSLMAWVQLLDSQGIDKSITEEMQKDVDRLHKVTDRFSKIGSGTKLADTDLHQTISSVLTYLRPRISDKVELSIDIPEQLIANHNASLMEWVIENICKNAVDAMEAEGKLHVKAEEVKNWIHIDITDTGKGIAPKQFKTIFEPGFSTKQRGWGLGLSLVKRIIENYHKGKVFVLESQVDVGTTFRISLPKES